jgi:hypothetical protein
LARERTGSRPARQPPQPAVQRRSQTTIFGIADDRIVWGRLYLEDVEDAGQDIGQAVQHMARGA